MTPFWVCSSSPRTPLRSSSGYWGTAGAYGLKKEKYEIVKAVGHPVELVRYALELSDNLKL